MPSSVRQLLDQLDGGRRVTAVLVVFGALAVMWGFFRWANEPAWVPVFRELPMESMASVTTRLDEAGVAYRLDRGGSGISVAEGDLARSRVLLAAEGFPGGGQPGFELFDQPSWGMTDFTQRVNYRRALEGELERTLGRMRGVEEAQVHLGLREASFLKRDGGPGRASVVLKLRTGSRPEDAMVEGVRFLVSGSVEGLESEHVTVLDDSGRLLSVPDDPSAPGAGSSRQLGVRQEIERYLESKAEALVTPIVGQGNASVRVAADLNFDRVDRTTQEVDPETQVTVQEDRSEIIPGTEEQGASSVNSNATFENSRTVETLSRTGVRIARLSVAVLVNEEPGSGAEEGATGLARVDGETLARIDALVRSAVGLDEGRGDRISVTAVPFGVRPAGLPISPEGGGGGGPELVEWVQMLQRPLVALVGLALSAFVALRLLETLSTSPAGRRQALPAPDGPEGRLDEPSSGRLGSAAPQVGMPEPREIEVKRPEMTARVIKSWLKDA